jgi:hypothetical protein
MVVESDLGESRIDLPVLKAVARARRWSLDLIVGRTPSLGDLARREKVDGRSLRRLINHFEYLAKSAGLRRQRVERRDVSGREFDAARRDVFFQMRN